MFLKVFKGLQIYVCEQGFQKGSNERIPFLEAFLTAFLRDPILETLQKTCD